MHNMQTLGIREFTMLTKFQNAIKPIEQKIKLIVRGCVW